MVWCGMMIDDSMMNEESTAAFSTCDDFVVSQICMDFVIKYEGKTREGQKRGAKGHDCISLAMEMPCSARDRPSPPLPNIIISQIHFNQRLADIAQMPNSIQMLHDRPVLHSLRAAYTLYPTLRFLGPRLKISTSFLFGGIGLCPILGGVEPLIRGGGGEEAGPGLGLETIELMTSDGLGLGREDGAGGDEDCWYGREAADRDCDGREDADDDTDLDFGFGASSNRSSTSSSFSMKSSMSSSEEPT